MNIIRFLAAFAPVIAINGMETLYNDLNLITEIIDSHQQDGDFLQVPLTYSPIYINYYINTATTLALSAISYITLSVLDMSLNKLMSAAYGMFFSALVDYQHPITNSMFSLLLTTGVVGGVLSLSLMAGIFWYRNKDANKVDEQQTLEYGPHDNTDKVSTHQPLNAREVGLMLNFGVRLGVAAVMLAYPIGAINLAVASLAYSAIASGCLSLTNFFYNINTPDDLVPTKYSIAFDIFAAILPMAIATFLPMVNPSVKVDGFMHI